MKYGRYFLGESSSEMTPASALIAAASAVSGFVQDPMPKSVRAVTGSESATLRRPKPCSSRTRSSFTITTDAPGTPSSVRFASMARPMSAMRRAAAAESPAAGTRAAAARRPSASRHLRSGLRATHWPPGFCSPSAPDWAGGLREAWVPGEVGALSRLVRFADNALPHYHKSRDLPAIEGTSRLSPHLAFGEIGPQQVWQPPRRSGPLTRRKSSWPSSAGGSSPTICSFTTATLPGTISGWTSTPFPGPKPIRTRSKPGDAAVLGIPSWMPACASCGLPAGCTIASG